MLKQTQYVKKHVELKRPKKRSVEKRCLMKKQTRLMLAVMSAVSSVSLHAHEGHAAMGSIAHEIEHAGWVAGALVVASVMIVWGFSAAATFADKVVYKPSKRL
jgi:hypothetical protein